MHGAADQQNMEKQLQQIGICGAGKIYANLSPACLYELALKRGEGVLSEDGALMVMTGQHTGRSPNDKYIVRDPSTEKEINFGKVNQPYEPAAFDALRKRAQEWLKGRDVFVMDLYAGADPRHRLPVRIVTTNAWHALFARNMFVRPAAGQLESHKPEFFLLHVPEFHADPAVDKTVSGTFVMVNFAARMAMIGGTSYAGEIKKTIFTVMNHLLPEQGVFPMHASANIGSGGDVAVFFGLSGTGKTTLSADGSRTLIGDDEHGWSGDAVFNFEGGCYAKAIRLNPGQEPEIYAAARRFGTVLENVVYDSETRKVDFDDGRHTENTRACYPIHFIPNSSETGVGGPPKNIIMLTCDAYGVLPPVCRLSREQAMYQFLSGYTAKVAGTEKGVKEPQATFSACFGAPFLPRPAEAYAAMLGKKLEQSGAACWLVNTGWTGGGYGVGERIPINVSRAIVNAILSGELDEGRFVRNEPFGLMVPEHVRGVADDLLHPRKMWKDTSAYDSTAQKLISLFAGNFKKFESGVSSEVKKGALGV